MSAVDMGPPNATHVTSAATVGAEVDHRQRCLECSRGVRECYKLRRLLREFTNAQLICAKCGWPLSAYHTLGCPFAEPVKKENPMRSDIEGPLTAGGA